MENKVKTVKEISEDENMKAHSGLDKEPFIFKKSDLPPDTIKVKVGKDGAPLTPPEPLTVKADYSSRAITADSWIYDVPDNTGKRNTYNIGQLGIPSPEAFRSPVHGDSIAFKNI